MIFLEVFRWIKGAQPSLIFLVLGNSRLEMQNLVLVQFVGRCVSILKFCLLERP